MKKITLVFIIAIALMMTGCQANNKNLYLPEAKKDKIYTTVGGNETLYQGEGYTLTVPVKNYRYEKDYDDGELEETWEYIKNDDIQLKVSTYPNSDEISARGEFLRDHDDYIFEDLTGYSLCGTKLNGDQLWFHLYESNGTVYIVSWEYPEKAKNSLKQELAEIAATFRLIE